MILVTYIFGVLCLLMSGSFITSILFGHVVSIEEPHWTQWFFAIVGFLLGNFLLIACIGKSSVGSV